MNIVKSIDGYVFYIFDDDNEKLGHFGIKFEKELLKLANNDNFS